MFKRVLFITYFLFLFTIPYSNARANVILTPFKNEVVITNKERIVKTLEIRNDTQKAINITPIVFSYDPQNQVLIDTKSYIFVRTDTEIFEIKPNATLELTYEIIPPNNLVPGTYFNLIVLQKQLEETFVNETNPVGAIDSLSHLVVMHVKDSESSVLGIASDFANISIEIEEQGIPFIKPTKIRYTYQNITSYVLTPKGEIQIFNPKSDNPPIYVHINENQEKLYPGGTMEESYYIPIDSLKDILMGRKFVGRFYNGIDENMESAENIQEPNYLLIGSVITIAVAFVILGKSLITDTRRKTEVPSQSS